VKEAEANMSPSDSLRFSLYDVLGFNRLYDEEEVLAETEVSAKAGETENLVETVGKVEAESVEAANTEDKPVVKSVEAAKTDDKPKVETVKIASNDEKLSIITVKPTKFEDKPIAESAKIANTDVKPTVETFTEVVADAEVITAAKTEAKTVSETTVDKVANI
jgi:hypothetical protein